MNQELYGTEYWNGRTNLELKHLLLANNFIKYFSLPINVDVLDYGCGNGTLVHALRELNVDAIGYEPSDVARKNAYGLAKNNIFGSGNKQIKKVFDLVLCIDVLEHIDVRDIASTIQDIYDNTTGDAVFSICFEDDPNFNEDPTHVTKRSKEWWVDVLTIFGFKVREAPKEWLWGNQFLICEK